MQATIAMLAVLTRFSALSIERAQSLVDYGLPDDESRAFPLAPENLEPVS